MHFRFSIHRLPVIFTSGCAEKKKSFRKPLKRRGFPRALWSSFFGTSEWNQFQILSSISHFTQRAPPKWQTKMKLEIIIIEFKCVLAASGCVTILIMYLIINLNRLSIEREKVLCLNNAITSRAIRHWNQKFYGKIIEHVSTGLQFSN